MVRAATLAAAVALGVFVGLGLRSGASLSRLGVVTLRLRGLPEFVSPDRGAVGAAMLGGLHVVLISGVWGAAAGALAATLQRLGRGPAVVGAAVLALGGVVIALDVALPIAFRIGAGSLTWGERALVDALTMLAGVAAARLATEGRRDAS